MFMTRLMRSAIPGSELPQSPSPKVFLYSWNITSASILARCLRWFSTSVTYSSRNSRNSSSVSSKLAMISIAEQMTPHLLAELSFTIKTPLSVSFTRASCSMKMLAASTMSGDDGFPSFVRNDCQLSIRIVFGRPPAGKKASAMRRLCMLSHMAWPCVVSRRWSAPSAVSFDGSKLSRLRSLWTKRKSSSKLMPFGSSTQALWSTIPRIFALSP
mmetsp:Transcript_22019/g.53907  ORF Transcript_22019/g.53907 Transcript_22019/m.53907 type:complete len:214 (+) Transcript_22019:784-1425(+)